MPATLVHSRSINQLQAKKLAGCRWILPEAILTFANYDPQRPGDPPWRSGGEAIAYPLQDASGRVSHFAKFFDPSRISEKRVKRILWLIGQDLSSCSNQLQAAPSAWLDTQAVSRPEKIDFDFSCCLTRAVPGKTWHEIKAAIVQRALVWTPSLRERAASDLVRVLSQLEQRWFIHGDLSPGNLLVNIAATSSEPLIYVIDFDSFVCPDADRLKSLSTQEGGSYGTEGYCPPDLVAAATRPVTPYTDRHARDVLLVELLCFDDTCDPTEPASLWPAAKRRSLLWNSPLAAKLPHLQLERLADLTHDQRPSSGELGHALGLPTSPRVKRRTSSNAARTNGNENFGRTLQRLLACYGAAESAVKPLRKLMGGS